MQEAPYVMNRSVPNRSRSSSSGNSNSTSNSWSVIDGYEGYMIDLLKLLFAQLGQTYTVRLAEDGRYGSFNTTTKRWAGMIGEVISGVCI